MISVDTSCMVCGASKHPLHACKKFKSLTTEQCMGVVRTNRLSYNCSRSSHFKPQCTSNHECQKCWKSQHTVLHQQLDPNIRARASNRVGHGKTQALPAEVDNSSSCHSSNLSHPDRRGKRSMLLMTCQVVVMMSDGQMTKARVLCVCA